MAIPPGDVVIVYKRDKILRFLILIVGSQGIIDTANTCAPVCFFMNTFPEKLSCRLKLFNLPMKVFSI